MVTYADALIMESLLYEKARYRQEIIRSRIIRALTEYDKEHSIEEIKNIEPKIEKLIRSSAALWKDFAEKKALKTFSTETAEF